jgi:hypothetical protein
LEIGRPTAQLHENEQLDVLFFTPVGMAKNHQGASSELVATSTLIHRHQLRVDIEFYGNE